MNWIPWVIAQPAWQPTTIERQVADLLSEAPPGVGLFVVPNTALQQPFPWMAVIRTGRGC